MFRHLRLLSLPCLVLFLCVGNVLAQEAEETPEETARHAWMEGYEAMTQADRAAKDNSPLAALQGYEAALKVFKQVQRDYPKWNSALINYRIGYCQKKIE